jgi:hypothetical protein
VGKWLGSSWQSTAAIAQPVPPPPTQAARPPLAPGSVRRTPAGRQSKETDVWVPFQWAVITGVITMCCILMLAWVVAPVIDIRLVLRLALGVFVTATACAWVLQSWLTHRTLWQIERTIAEQAADALDAHITQVNPAAGRRAAEGAARDELRRQFETFVRACTLSTAERSFKGKLRSRYDEFKGLLLSSGWATMDEPGRINSAWHLAVEADEILAALADGAGTQLFLAPRPDPPCPAVYRACKSAPSRTRAPARMR